LAGAGHVDYLDLVRGQIDISRDPFSDRGSRLIVRQVPGTSSLEIKLGERLTALDPHPEAYMSRPAFVQDLQFVDAEGSPLDFESLAAPDVVVFRTRLGEFRLLFQDEDTLAIGIPDATVAGIRFALNTDHFRPGPGKAPLRNLVLATNGEIARERNGRSVECILSSGKDLAILLHIGKAPAPPESISAFSVLLGQSASRWRAWFERLPPVVEKYAAKYAYAWWVMANNLISPRGCIQFEAMAPSKAFYIGLWLWDSALHAIAYRHVDPEMARDQIRAFLALQRPDGMLPDAIFDEDALFELDHPIQGKVTKPPILAWAALKIHETAPDLAFLREIYPGLSRLNEWWFEQNDDDADGLVGYAHPYSSGLDDSPLWDHGLPVESPDINTYLILSMQSLASMAGMLGLVSDADIWRMRADHLLQRILDDMWDEQAGVFRALVEEQPIPVVTPINLLPLWAGSLPGQILDRLISNLTDTDKFWGGFMLPTVARGDLAFDPGTMWRGPVWANINYFFIEALKRAGRADLARELRTATLKLIISQPSIYEYYSAANGVPPVHSVPAFGWTAAIFIDLAIQASREAAAGC